MIKEPAKTAGDIAFRTGALVPCPTCGLFAVRTADERARRAALAMAERAWRSRCKGFEGIELEDALSTVQVLIRDTRAECPGCQAMGGD